MDVHQIMEYSRGRIQQITQMVQKYKKDCYYLSGFCVDHYPATAQKHDHTLDYFFFDGFLFKTNRVQYRG